MLAAAPAELRAWGVSLGQLGDHLWSGSDHTYLNWPASTGEVQVFADFAARVDRAAKARETLYPGRSNEPLEQFERETIWLATSG